MPTLSKCQHLQWFYDRGCKWIKLCADPGDVILWDSRCIHYGASPEGDSPRMAIVRARLLPRMGLRERLTDDRNRCVLQAGGGHHSGVRGEAERSDGRVSDDRWYLHQSRRIERLNAGHRVMIHYCSDLSGSKVTARFPRTNRLNRRSHPSSLIEPSSWRGSRRIRLGQVASGCIDGWYESSSRSQGSTKHRHA